MFISSTLNNYVLEAELDGLGATQYHAAHSSGTYRPFNIRLKYVGQDLTSSHSIHDVSPIKSPIDNLNVVDEWDAGDMGCGEILILLRSRMRDFEDGDVLKLTTRDLGAPEDLPAWCRLTGRRLAHADHPDYWIEQSNH